MNLQQTIDFFLKDRYFSLNIHHVIKLPEKKTVIFDFPEDLSDSLKEVLRKRNINGLYAHQLKAYKLIRNQKNVFITTSTASGKTLSFILPILQHKLDHPQSKVLLLYPTKALSRDQENWMQILCNDLKLKIKVNTYDGDTELSKRSKIRKTGDFIITNPDMLHSGILPKYTNWSEFFQYLDFIVIDEVHTYKGIFGSHFANVIRRLLRILSRMNKKPVFVAASATIGNPKEFIEKLTEQEFEIINEDSSGRGEKIFILYNPPRVIENRTDNSYIRIPEDSKLNNYQRVSALKETVKIAEVLIKNQISTIIFCKSRREVELLTNYLKEQCPAYEDQIEGYRSGYTPEERREIEKKLRAKKIIAVISTNALELGIDIGTLEVSISVGYPGSIHSFFQQSGRAGRKSDISLSILVANDSSLDQYIMKRPDFLIYKSPENVRINPDNIYIVSDHLKCSILEKPFEENEQFGKYPNIIKLLDDFVQKNIAVKNGKRYYLMSNMDLARSINIRNGSIQNFVIEDMSIGPPDNAIGEMDYYSAPLFLHPQAIYLHNTKKYIVEELLWDKRIAKVRAIETDYYTQAVEDIQIKPLFEELKFQNEYFIMYQGDLSVTSIVSAFKKIKFYTEENLGFGNIDLPSLTMDTQGCWILFEPSFFNNVSIDIILQSMTHIFSIVSLVVAMCERNDIRVISNVMDSHFDKPVIYIYDNYPGGLEISYFILRNFSTILEDSIKDIENCDCERGCPSCIGLYYLSGDNQINYKEQTKQYLEKLLFLFKNL